MNITQTPGPSTVSIEDTVEQPSGIRLSAHGVSYQLKLLLLTMFRARQQGLIFSLGTEVAEADKFDDIVFSYHKENKPDKKYRFLQVKHRQDDSKTIKYDDLLDTNDEDFSLLKYFNSYRKIEGSGKFNGDRKDFTIYTNIDLDNDVKDLDAVEEIDMSGDKVFRQKKCYNCKWYKFKTESTFYDSLERIFKENHAKRLALSLAKVVFNNKLVPDNLMKIYSGWLLNRVLLLENVNNKRCIRFQDTFLHTLCKGDTFLNDFKRMVTQFYHAMRKNKTPYNIHDVFRNMNVLVPKTFNVDTAEFISLDVSDHEIRTFFEKFVLAAKQPNESVLGNIIAKEIAQDMNVIEGKLLASRVLESMLDWVNERKGRFQKLNDFENIFDNLKQDFARIGLISHSVLHKTKFETTYEFKDSVKVIETVKRFLKENQKQMLVVYYKNELLTTMKLLQAMDNPKLDEVIFIDINSLQKLVVNINITSSPLDAFCSKAYNCLVINIDSMEIFDTAKETMKMLYQILSTRPSKRIILNIKLAHKDLIDKQLNEETLTSSITLEDYDNNFLDLNEESRQKLLEKSKVIFQGNEVALRSMIHKDSALIRGEVLSSLILEERIYVGESPTNESYDEVRDYYVERTFRRNVIANNNISSVVEESKNDFAKNLYLITEEEEYFKNTCRSRKNSNVHWLKKVEQFELTHDIECSSCKSCYYSDKSIIVLPNCLASEEDLKLSDAIILISDKEEKFQEMRDGYNDKVVYWLKKTEDVYTLQETHNLGLELKNVHDESAKHHVLVVNRHASKSDIKVHQVIIIISNRLQCTHNCRTLKHVWEHNDTKHIMYWINRCEVFIWQQSVGNLIELRTYIEKSPVTFTSRQVANSSDKVTIIAAEPGMGKSTTLTHLALNVKLDGGVRWTIKIDLKKHLDDFLDRTTFNNNDMIKFIYKAMLEPLEGSRSENENICEIITVDANGKATFTAYVKTASAIKLFEVELFTYFYNQGRVVVFLDGFDEISPDCKSVVLDCIKALQNSRVEKAFVATRPYNNIKSELEDTLGTFAFKLVPLKEHEQVSIIINVWEKKLKCKLNEERCKRFINTLLEIISSQIKYGDSNISLFKGIPLHVTMIATVYEKAFTDFYGSKCDQYDFIHLRQTFSPYSLYDCFLKMKLDLAYKEEGDLSQRKAMKALRKQKLKEHQYLALFELFSKDELHNLLPEKTLQLVPFWLDSIMQADEKTGLIDRVAMTRDKPHYVHRTFAEYFAADLLACMLDPRDEDYNSLASKFLYDSLTKKDSQTWVLFKFLNYKAVDNCVNRTVLIAALNGDPRAISSSNANVEENETRDPFGRTPLHFVCCNINPELYNVLFEKNDNNHLIKDSLFGWTPLHYAAISAQFTKNEYEKITFTSDSINAAAHIRDVYRHTPVILTIMMRCNLVFVLTKPRPNIVDSEDETIMQSIQHYIAYTLNCENDQSRDGDETRSPVMLMWKRAWEQIYGKPKSEQS